MPKFWLIGHLPDPESANAATQKAWPKPEAPTLPVEEVSSANKPIERGRHSRFGLAPAGRLTEQPAQSDKRRPDNDDGT